MESSWLSISDWRPRPRLFSLDKPLHISSGWVEKDHVTEVWNFPSNATIHHHEDILTFTHIYAIFKVFHVRPKLKVLKELILATGLVVWVICRWCAERQPITERVICISGFVVMFQKNKTKHFNKVQEVHSFSQYLSCCRGPCEPPWGACSVSSHSVWMSYRPSTQLQMLKHVHNKWFSVAESSAPSWKVTLQCIFPGTIAPPVSSFLRLGWLAWYLSSCSLLLDMALCNLSQISLV